jgi:transcriptional regulator with XRE-family HTH domain
MLYTADMAFAFASVLKKARKAAGLTQAQLGAKLGVTSQAVSQWERSETMPEAGKFGEIADALTVSTDRLLRSKGDDTQLLTKLAKMAGGLRSVESDDPAAVIRPTTGILEIDIRAGMGGGGVTDREVRHDGHYADPVKEESWSFPSSFMREELRAPANRIIIVETQGDSMIPTISPGERLVVDAGHKLPTPDGIYALRDRYGAIVVKRLQTLRRGNPPRLMIISDNESHHDEEVGADEIEIVGRVICGLKRY